MVVEGSFSTGVRAWQSALDFAMASLGVQDRLRRLKLALAIGGLAPTTNKTFGHDAQPNGLRTVVLLTQKVSAMVESSHLGHSFLEAAGGLPGAPEQSKCPRRPPCQYVISKHESSELPS